MFMKSVGKFIMYIQFYDMNQNKSFTNISGFFLRSLSQSMVNVTVILGKKSKY